MGTEFCKCDPTECAGEVEARQCRWEIMRKAGWLSPADHREMNDKLEQLGQTMRTNNATLEAILRKAGFDPEQLVREAKGG